MNTEKQENEMNKEGDLEFLLKKNEDRLLKKRLLNEFGDLKSTNQKSHKFFWLILCLLIIIGLSIFTMNQINKPMIEPVQIANLYIQEIVFDNFEVVRGESESLNQNLIKLFNQNDFKGIMTLSNNGDILTTQESKFIVALATLKTDGDYSKVIELTNELILSESYLKTEALWINSLALIKTGDKSLSIERLETLKEIGYKVDEAKKLIEVQ